MQKRQKNRFHNRVSGLYFGRKIVKNADEALNFIKNIRIIIQRF